MKLIPVLDLKGGNVVHARKGERSAYRPVETHLSRGSGPVDVCRGLLTLYPFPMVYIADLDSIERTGDNSSQIHELAEAFPEVLFWVDNGLRKTADCAAWLDENAGVLVLGSESLETAASLAALLKTGKDRLALSLDFRGDDFMGPEDILLSPDLWPQRVIVMSLKRVGSGQGPDMKHLREMMEKGGGREIFAAGGVTGVSDLEVLADLGVAGVLLASALYDGSITGENLSRFESP